jgi:hypothetical protein
MIDFCSAPDYLRLGRLMMSGTDEQIHWLCVGCNDFLTWILIREVVPSKRVFRGEGLPSSAVLFELIRTGHLGSLFCVSSNDDLDYCEGASEEARRDVHDFVKANYKPEIWE